MIIYTILNKLDQADWSSKSVKKVTRITIWHRANQSKKHFACQYLNLLYILYGCKGILMAIFQAKINDRSELVSSSNYARLMDL